jgi:uncharacterized protein YehS (DUF1456 family)
MNTTSTPQTKASLAFKPVAQKKRVISNKLFEKLWEISHDNAEFVLNCIEYNKLMDCSVPELKTRFRALGMNYYNNSKKKYQVVFLLYLRAVEHGRAFKGIREAALAKEKVAEIAICHSPGW